MKLVLMLMLISFSSCLYEVKESEVSGIYVAVGYVNTFDTTFLKKDGSYLRRIYDKENNLVISNEGKWEMRNNGRKIFFNSYYLNYDRDFSIYPEMKSDQLASVELILEKKSPVSFSFCIGLLSPDFPENCYQKIEMK